MKMIILAAGKGERLMPLTKNTPKPLIDVGNGNTLLEEQMISIRESGAIDEVILVVGYLAEQIEAKMRAYHDRGFKIRTLYNPFWRTSNNLISLWLARHFILDNDAMVTNGDNIFSPRVFAGLAEKTEGVWLSVCPKTKFDLDDMKVQLVEGFVSSVSKTTPGADSIVESPGLMMVRGERYRQIFVEQLEGTVRDDESNNKFWLEVFNRMWSKGAQVRPWIFESAGNWQEIDFHVDVSHMRELLAEKVMRLSSQKMTT